MSYKPKGYNSVSVYLVVNDAEAQLRFIGETFGAEKLREFRRDDGSIMHAECRIDDTVIMVGQPQGQAEPASAMIHVYVDDPDAVYARALNAGAMELQPVMEKGDGDRRGGFRDPWGHSWYVARQI